MKSQVRQFLAGIALAATMAGQGAQAGAKDRAPPPPPAGQADFPQVLGDPFTVDGVTYTPADTASYDAVGHAAVGSEGTGISAAHRTLPLPSYVEVTALETGRTVLVRVDRRGPMTGSLLVELSPAAAEQLGMVAAGRAPVRVRRINPPEIERAALREGRPASPRMDTPPGLRSVLLRRLQQQGAGTQVSPTGPMLTPDKLPAVAAIPAPAAAPAVSSAPPPRLKPAAGVAKSAAGATAPATPVVKPVVSPPKPVATNASPPSPNGAYTIQVGAFSAEARAASVARAAGGRSVATGKLWRVWVGSFATVAEAQAALAKVKASGYAEARVMPAK